MYRTLSRRVGSIASVLLALAAGCGDDNGTKPDPPGPTECGRILVVTTDYAVGSLATIQGDSSLAVQSSLASIHSDARARVHGDFAYVVNRLGGDNVQVVNMAEGFQTIRQIPMGPGSNPYDIALVSGSRAFVSRFGSTGLIEFDPSTGAVRDTIDLSPLADGDGIPDMDRLFYRAPYLYVSIQRIDFGGGTYAPVPPSYLAVVDTRDNSLVDVDAQTAGVQGIALAGLNPSAPMIWDEASSLLLVPETGLYGELDGGVEKVDLERRESAGWLVREEALGGDLIDFALSSNGRGYAAVSLPGESGSVTSIVRFDPATGAAIGAITTSDGYDFSDLIVTRCGYLMVCDRSYTQPGVRIYDAVSDQEELLRLVLTGLPPFELVEVASAPF